MLNIELDEQNRVAVCQLKNAPTSLLIISLNGQ